MLTLVTDAPDWLDTSPVANLPTRDLRADLYNNASTLMACRPDVVIAHLRMAKITFHIVNVACADASAIETD